MDFLGSVRRYTHVSGLSVCVCKYTKVKPWYDNCAARCFRGVGSHVSSLACLVSSLRFERGLFNVLALVHGPVKMHLAFLPFLDGRAPTTLKLARLPRSCATT